MKKRFLPLVCFIGTLLFTILASVVPLNGVTQADISNKFFTIITPAGFTFSIWLIIYLSWFIISLMVAFKDFTINKEQKLLFSTSMVLTAFWLVPWHFSHVGMSFSVMILLLFVLSLLFIETRWDAIDKKFQATVELFFWWILVATILNWLVLLVSLGSAWKNLAEVSVGIWFLFIGFIINLFLLNKMEAFIPTFVFIWWLYGISMGQQNFYIQIASLLFAIVLLLNYIFLRKKAYKKAIKKIFKK